MQTFADTIVKEKELVIRYNYNLDTITQPTVIETSTIIISDSIDFKSEFKALHNDNRYDSLNFMNCVYDEKFYRMKWFLVNNNILEADIYLPAYVYNFYTGAVSYSKEGNLILSKGANKFLQNNFGGKPDYSRIKFKVYIPSGIKIKSLIYQCS